MTVTIDNAFNDFPSYVTTALKLLVTVFINVYSADLLHSDRWFQCYFM